MFRVLTLCFIISTASADMMNKKLCGRIFHPNAMRCCQINSDTLYKIELTDELSECFQLSKDPISCERELCIAKKKGIATKNNKLDMNKLEEHVTKDFASDADLLADIKSKCLKGDFAKYAPPDFCDFMKMRHCVSMQILNNCPKWAENIDCQETKGLVEQCVKIISE